MSTIVIDYETYYDGTCSLTKLTYEQYMRHRDFIVQCVGIKVDNEEPYIVWYDDVEPELRRLFPKGNKHTLVCHNMNFDGPIFNWIHGCEAHKYLCTQRMSAGLWPHESSSLAMTAKRCWPRNQTKRKGKELVNYKGIRDIPVENRGPMERYCKQDVQLTFDIVMRLAPFFPEEELHILDITARMFIGRPFEVDRPLLEEYFESEEKRREKIIKDSGLSEEVLASNDKFAKWIIDQDIPFNKVLSPTARNPQNMKWPLAKDSQEFLQLQLEYPEHKNQWDARLAVASNIELTRTRRVLEHSMVHKTNPDGKLGCAINAYAAHTLRFGGTNKTNFQNMGRESPIRRSLLAPDGYKVVVHDQSAIEARMNAWFNGEQDLLGVWKSGGDVYCTFAERVYGRKITKKDDPLERFVGKVCILGLGYQMGAERLRRTLVLGQMGPPVDISITGCRTLVNVYRNAYSNISGSWRECERALGIMMSSKLGSWTEWRGLQLSKNSVKLPNGMMLRYPKLQIQYDEDSGDSNTVYWNGKYWVNIYGGKFLENIIQALARVTIAGNMVAIGEIVKGYGDKSQIALQVHDEIVSVVSNKNLNDYMERVERAMCTPPHWCFSIPLDVEGGYAQNYSK